MRGLVQLVQLALMLFAALASGATLSGFLVLSGILALSGCSDERAARPMRRTPPPPPDDEMQPGYAEAEVVNGGTLSGTITWSGPVPEELRLPVSLHATACGESQRSPALTIGRRGGVASTVVYLDGVRAGRPLTPPASPVTIDIESCSFAPHVVAVGAGWPIRIRNGEALLHNVHATLAGGAVTVGSGASSATTWIDVGLPAQGDEHTATLAAPGIARLVDDAGHTWMLAWVHAFEHPYFAVSDAEGRFRISDVPPGQYVVRAWHEGWRVAEVGGSGSVATLGTQAGRPSYSAPIVLSRPVTVQTGQDTTIDFQLDAAAAAAAGD